MNNLFDLTKNALNVQGAQEKIISPANMDRG